MKNILRVAVIVFLFFVIAVNGFSGGTKEEEKSETKSTIEKQVTITWWGHNFPAMIVMYEAIIDEFEKENPNIKVDYYQKPGGQYPELFLQAYAAGSAPDVYRVGDWLIDRFIEEGVAEPFDLTAFNANSVQDVVDRFEKGVLDPFLRNDNLYAIPEDVSILLMFANLTHLKEAGYNQTPSDAASWVEVMKKTTVVEGDRWARSGFEWKYDHELWDTQQFTTLLRNEGTTLFDSNKNLVLDKQKTLKAIQYYYDSIHKDKFANPDFAATFGSISPDVFTRGFASTYTAGPWAIPLIENQGVVKDWVATDWETGPESNYFRWSWSFGLNSQTKNKYEATKYIAFMADTKIAEMRRTMAGTLPGLKNWRESEWVKSNPKVKPFFDALNKSEYLDKTPDYAKTSIAVSNMLQEVSMGGMKPEEAYELLFDELSKLK